MLLSGFKKIIQCVNMSWNMSKYDFSYVLNKKMLHFYVYGWKVYLAVLFLLHVNTKSVSKKEDKVA